ncbi:PEGA domain-containing protein [Candidatus Gottesmanbacteria bacterium]|nr:PEGA domain-containing protein [Candidatus Gottesmanbacteria bacterium]
MDKRVLGVILLLLAALSFAGYKYFTSQGGGLGGLRVVSTPTASVFLAEKLLGRTPYEDKLKSGEYIVKLIPEGNNNSATTWQGKVTLNPGVLTFVNRELGSTDLNSAGEILTLEKISEKDAQIAALTSPDGAIISLDGQEKGAAPLILRNVSVGDHDISVSSSGFNTRTIKVRTTEGYKLTANFQLAVAGGVSATPSAAPSSPDEIDKPYVTIKETPVGFLRVRTAPSIQATEAAQIKPGEKYPLLDEESGWYKIRYQEDKEGWISGTYATKEE